MGDNQGAARLVERPVRTVEYQRQCYSLLWRGVVALEAWVPGQDAISDYKHYWCS